MAYFDFDPVKNLHLKKTRHIGFEDVIVLIEAGHLIATTPHPNAEKYPHQWMYHVAVEDYVYLVPWVRDGDRIFLKTIYPSRKATRHTKKGVLHA